MNAFLFAILMGVLIGNFLFYPIVAGCEAAFAFVTRTAYRGTADKWQAWKYDREFLPDAPDQASKVFRWLVMDLCLAFVVLVFAAWLGNMGILWVPVVAVGLLFGLRAYIDRYGKEWKVKL